MKFVSGKKLESRKKYMNTYNKTGWYFGMYTCKSDYK